MNKNNRRTFLKTTGAIALGSTLPFQLAQAAGDNLTVGFIYPGARDDFGYIQAHAQAAAIVKKMPGVNVIEQENVPETFAAQQAMEAMIVQDGATLLFATSFGYLDPHVLKVAEKYPNVRFAHCGVWTKGKHPANVSSYFGRFEQTMYLDGVIAGHMSKSKKLGWVAAKPVPQVLIDINAFTLGAQSVDPSITTHVIFTGDWSLPIKEAEATNSLIDQGCDVLTCNSQSPRVVVETAERRGAMSCGNYVSLAKLAPKGYLTGTEWDWSTPDAAYVKEIQQGKPMTSYMRGGLKEGFVKNSTYGPAVSAAAKANVDDIRTRMLAGKYPIFKGPLKDNKGGIVIRAGVVEERTATLDAMNYLVAGVIGQA
jgi:simple sugar transport system substrate-binding protein